ncbi:MAG: hypothetical protein N3E37_02400 [Candidatus Micrarchaeota archaeon]|nr:hypothetical protein [Candidatus Micrarchaeota archaeon]
MTEKNPNEINELLRLLESKFGEQTEMMISQLLKKFNYLISREMAIELLAKEHNLIQYEKEFKIKEILEKMSKGEKLNSVTFSARLKYFMPTKIVMKKGNALRIREIVLEDEEERLKLVFWNEAINVLSNFSIGDLIKFKNTYVYSNSLTYGKSSSYSIKEKAKLYNPDEDILIEKNTYLLQGTVVEIEPEYYYMRNGKEEKMRSFRLALGNTISRVVVWDAISRLEKIIVGDIIRVEGAYYKNSEFHVNSLSRLIKLKVLGEDVIVGRIEKIWMENNQVFVRVAERDFIIQKELLNKFLSTKEIKQDISPDTIIDLSKLNLIGKKVAFKQNDSIVKDVYLL